MWFSFSGCKLPRLHPQGTFFLSLSSLIPWSKCPCECLQLALHLWGSQHKEAAKGQMNSKFYFRIRQSKLYSLILACMYVEPLYTSIRRENLSFQEVSQRARCLENTSSTRVTFTSFGSAWNIPLTLLLLFASYNLCSWW